MDDNIKLIKFACNKSKVFNFDSDNNCIDFPSKEWIYVDSFKHWDTWFTDYYPLLLSKAVDGINETDPWKIDIYYEPGHGWAWSYKDYHKVNTTKKLMVPGLLHLNM